MWEGFVCVCIACLRTRKDEILRFFQVLNMNAMWMSNFLSFLKFTDVAGSVLLIKLTDGEVQLRNRLISDAIASLDL